MKRSVVRLKLLLCAATAAAALSATSAQAQSNFSFAGTLNDPNQVLFFDFDVGDASTVTLVSYSYAGGVNAAGQVIARGGFDPILGVYNAAGIRIGQNDDGGGSVPADSVTGLRYDTYFQSLLTPGSYRAAVSVFPNFGPTDLNTGSFAGAGSFTDAGGNARDSHFAFDVLGVASATGPGGIGGVPEPATWALMILGFGGVGGAMRRRGSVRTTVNFA